MESCAAAVSRELGFRDPLARAGVRELFWKIVFALSEQPSHTPTTWLLLRPWFASTTSSSLVARASSGFGAGRVRRGGHLVTLKNRKRYRPSLHTDLARCIGPSSNVRSTSSALHILLRGPPHEAKR